jgi:crotonobetainyl-CoA:carnitine CoA-transferase CaiB-like acyl-CoA transferase
MRLADHGANVIKIEKPGGQRACASVRLRVRSKPWRIPVKLSDTPGELRRPAPSLGEHTGKVLDPFLAEAKLAVARPR